MDMPEHLHNYAYQILTDEGAAAEQHLEAKQKANRWAVVYGLVPIADGDQWCVLLGDDLQSGIAAFGDTPEKAIENFDLAMTARS